MPSKPATATVPTPTTPTGAIDWNAIFAFVEAAVAQFGPVAEPMIDQWLEASKLPPAVVRMVEAVVHVLLNPAAKK